MGNVSALVAGGTVQHYDFSRARHIVDVGGADGGLLLAILEASPHVRGTVFDRPQVVEAAREAIEAGLIKRDARLLAGISQAVPSGRVFLRAQIYLSRLEGRRRATDLAELPQSHHPRWQARCH